MPRPTASAARTGASQGETGTARAVVRKGQLKREKILWCAAKMFAERGYSGTTLSEIAAAAGTQAGSLYYHFDSRDDITRAVLKCATDVISSHVEAAWADLPASASPMERIGVGIRVHMQSILSDDPFLSAWNRIINEVEPTIRDEFVEYPRTYAKMWRDLIVQAQQSGQVRAAFDPSVTRLLLFGAMTWSLVWYDPAGKCSPDVIADHVTEIFFRGAATDSAARALADIKPPASGAPSTPRAARGRLPVVKAPPPRAKRTRKPASD
jgi:AcrR family transcriptional regulator